MKLRLSIISAIIFVPVLLALQGCIQKEDEIPDRMSLLLYIAGDNTLSSYAEGTVSQLREGYIPQDDSSDEVLLVFYHVEGGVPTLSRYYRNNKGVIDEEVIAIYGDEFESADVTCFSQVVQDAEIAYPSKKHGLVIWSHATGYLPEGYFNNPVETGAFLESFDTPDPYALLVRSANTGKTGDGDGCSDRSFSTSSGNEEDSLRSVGVDGQDNEMDIRELADALTSHYEFIIFDCCLMGGIEVSYEFMDKTDYLIFSPTEIMARGFQYEDMVDPVFHNSDREAVFKSICHSFYEYYDAQSGVNQSATVSLVRTRFLPELATVCSSIFSLHRKEMESLNRNNIQPYFRYNKHWFYDLGDFVENISSADEYADFKSALEKVVIFKEATERFISIDITKYSGLSTYIPKPEYEYLNNYYKTLAWNMATGLVE